MVRFQRANAPRGAIWRTCTSARPGSLPFKVRSLKSAGFSEIRRLDGRRVVEVSADVDRTRLPPNR
ncbi:MAG: hypothetical protein CM15mP120_10670 [Pseudomonadota bacterium]|nr:MAG: hypothetical protein CM15mP120_10670 [Pseudomonadota bacterium]